MNFWLPAIGAALVVLAVFSAIISALETALMVADADTRRVLRQRSPEVAKRLDPFITTKNTAQNCLFLADSIFNTAVIALCLLTLQMAAGILNVGQLPSWVPLAGALAGLAFFCEVLPKVVALQRPEGVLARCVGLLEVVVSRMEPFSLRFQELQSVVFPRHTGWKEQETSKDTRCEELVALFEIAGEEGVLFPEEAAMMREIIRLGRENASHCMTPRVDAFLLPDDLDNEEAIALIRSRRHRRVPVHGETPDDVLGVLDVEVLLQEPGSPYTLQLEPPGFIPETMNALDLLQNFLLGRRRLALLLDEYGGFEGIVTLSDLIDELLGEQGQHSGSGLYLEKVSADRFFAGGNVRLDDLRDALDLKFAHSQAETLGGLLMERSGGIPRPGANFHFEGWTFEVRRSSRKRIKEVVIHRAPMLPDYSI